MVRTIVQVLRQSQMSGRLPHSLCSVAGLVVDGGEIVVSINNVESELYLRTDRIGRAEAKYEIRRVVGHIATRVVEVVSRINGLIADKTFQET